MKDRVRHTTKRAAIVLTGGEGSRLRDLTRRIAGHDVPKQFCQLIGSSTLLEQTMGRVALSVRPEHTLMVVNEAHEPFYTQVLGRLPMSGLVVQPDNRGTATAILYALMRMAEITSEVSVAVFPSDHFVDDDSGFMRHVEEAFEAVEEQPETTVLLGIKPDRAESGYGWIEYGDALSGKRAQVFQVQRFWEKPPANVATELMAQGCLWNSFVMVARLPTLLGLVVAAKPQLYAAFHTMRSAFGTPREQSRMRSLYAKLGSEDFSSDILACFPARLAVLPVRGLAWSDLGEPQRVMDALSRMGERPRWAAA